MTIENNGSVGPTTRVKIGSTFLLLIGSIPLYIFVLKIFAVFWSRDIWLLPGFVGFAGAALLWGGIKAWEGWRLPMGIICLLLASLATVNSWYYQVLKKAPEVAPYPQAPAFLDAMTNGSIVMAIVTAFTGLGLLIWRHKIKSLNVVE